MKQFVSVAIVEDQEEDFKILESFIKKYGEENSVGSNVSYFNSGISFIEKYRSDYDIVFMDIDMPNQNGLETAKELRKLDDKVILVFITNLAQLAIKGYSVNAFDFVPKPINYTEFSTLFKRALVKNSYEKKTEITIKSNRKIMKLDVLSLLYVEVVNHNLLFHALDETISAWGSLSNVYDELSKFGFVKVNNSLIANIRHVKNVNGYEITLDNDKVLYLSRGEKKDFYNAFSSYSLGDD